LHPEIVQRKWIDITRHGDPHTLKGISKARFGTNDLALRIRFGGELERVSKSAAKSQPEYW
jgi:hypothetical protein